MRKAVLSRSNPNVSPTSILPENASGETGEASLAFRRLATKSSSHPTPISSSISPFTQLPPRVPEPQNVSSPSSSKPGFDLDYPENPPDDWTALVLSEEEGDLCLPARSNSNTPQQIMLSPPPKNRRGVVAKGLRDHDSDTEDSSDNGGSPVVSEDELEFYQVSSTGELIQGTERSEGVVEGKEKRRKKKKGKKVPKAEEEVVPVDENVPEDLVDIEMKENKKKKKKRSEKGSVSDGNLSDSKKSDSEKKKKKRKKKKFVLAPANFISRLLLLWIFQLVSLCINTREKDLEKIGLSLRSSESAKQNGDALDQEWQKEVKDKKEKASLFHAIYLTFGFRFFLLAFWKLFWAGFTWFGSYAVLKWLIIYSEKIHSSIPTKPQTYEGHLIALGLLFSSAFAAICFHQLMSHSIQTGVQMRAALMVLIYRKSLKLSYIKGGVGDIVNLISNECNRIAEACVNWHFMWSAAVECIIIVVLVTFDIGLLSAIPSIVLVIFIILPLQYFLAFKASKISYATTELITKRVHMMSEILTAIKLIKFYAWEPFYKTRLTLARNTEIALLQKSLLLKIATFMVVFIAPVFGTLSCLLAFYYIPGGKEGVEEKRMRTASVVFVALSLFNTLRYPLVLLPQAVRSLAGASKSLKRLEEFFTQPEVDPIPALEGHSDSDTLMKFKNASFKWDGDLDHPHLSNLTLKIKRSQIIAVVGDVGSGKSLLAALMGQIKLAPIGENGRVGIVERYGSCGYVPQEPWLINASIQDNILFGLDYEEKKYSDVVRLCGLMRDLMLLSSGDQSFVSELNLSAAQSQRISLARCLYFDPDVVLLDDTLSEFDQGTAKRLFKETIRNYMARKCGKAVVLVTQQKQFLAECDQILVMKGGKVVEKGTYTELKERKVNFSAWVMEELQIEDDPTGLLEQMNEIRLEPVRKPLIHLPSAVHTPSPLATAKVITREDPAYNYSIGTGMLNPEQANELTIQHLQQLNSESSQFMSLNEQTISKMIELNQLSVLTSASGVVSGSSVDGSAPPAIGASKNRPRATPVNFQNQDVVRQTMDANQMTVHSSFDALSSSANTSHQTEEVGGEGIALQEIKEDKLSSSYQIYLQLASGKLLGLAVISLFTLVHGVRFLSDTWLSFNMNESGSVKHSDSIYVGVYAILTAAITLGVMGRGFMISAAVIKKSKALHERLLNAILHAPMSFYDITPVGQILSNFARHLFIVDDFLPESMLQVLSFIPILVGTVILVCIVVPWFWTTLPVYFIPAYFLIRRTWLAEEKLKRLEGMNKAPMFSHLSATLEGLFSIRLYHAEARFDAFNRSLIDADHKALYSLMLALFVVLFNVSPSHTGLALTNAQQLLLFVQWLVRMAWDVHSSMSSVSAVVQFSQHIPHEALDIVKANRPPPEWPQSGNIEFKNVVLRYNRYGVAVLKSVSFRIHSGEKIGIIGRSGSGKTTLLVALLRIVELTNGEILIDGINTGSIGLQDLRSRIAVIPQEPVLLSGTIRSNLDPHGDRVDEEIWKALKDARLNDKIKEMPMQLDTLVVENGKSFTQGERQLFCIARAILLKTSIVVLDEPATAVDPETDQLIQSVMFENFESSTVIILASRFNLIMQLDKVMVMDHGRVNEFDTPLALLDNPRSKFSLMVAQSADIDLVELRKSAAKRKWGGGTPGTPRYSKVRNVSVVSSSQQQVQQLHPLANTITHDVQSTVSTTSSANSESKMPRSLEDLFTPPPNADGRTSPTGAEIGTRTSKVKKLSTDLNKIITNIVSSSSNGNPSHEGYERIESTESSTNVSRVPSSTQVASSPSASSSPATSPRIPDSSVVTSEMVAPSERILPLQQLWGVTTTTTTLTPVIVKEPEVVDQIEKGVVEKSTVAQEYSAEDLEGLKSISPVSAKALLAELKLLKEKGMRK
ncbi:Canalicular multispecific organic anion transporter 2 [Nowakowskiella sp. JEL0407]|nr:Canalicular multispecific organic anion transporter 2 [Nowakowskiella sp. JEL0407]